MVGAEMNKIAVSLTVGLILLFVVLSLFIPADVLVSILSAGIFVAAAIGVARWGPAAWRVYFPLRGLPAPDRETRYGVLGLVLWLLSEGGKRIYSVTVIGLSRPDWVNDLYISAFLNGMTFAGLVLVIMATSFPDEKPAKVPPTVLALLAFLGVLISYALPALIAKVIMLGAMLAKLGVVAVH